VVEIDFEKLKKRVGEKAWMATALVVLALINLFSSGDLALGVAQLGVAVVTAVVVEEVAYLVLQKKTVFPSSAFITGMFVGGILGLGTPLYIVAIASAVAILSKKILVYEYSHLFNPANFGLLFAGVVLSSYGAWWISGNPQQLTFFGIPLLVAAIGLALCWKARRLPVGLTAIATELLIWSIVGFSSGRSIEFVFGNLSYFYAYFMVIEPITSPFRKKQMIAYGVLAGALPFVLGTNFFGLAAGVVSLTAIAHPLSLAVANLSVPLLGRLLPEQ